jgi:putative zinc finger protein
MDRDQIHTDRDELLDRYIRNEMTVKETGIFEEHLLSCEQCRKRLVELNEKVKSIQSHAARETYQSRSRKGLQSKLRPEMIRILVAAASILLVIGLFLISRQYHPSSSSQFAYSDTALFTDEIKVGAEAPGLNKGEVPIQVKEKKRVAYLAECQENPVFESQVGVYFRAGSLSVESPQDSIYCEIDSSIEFRYHGAETDSLFLVLFNNFGEILSEEKVASPHLLQMHFPEGLYYWQLSDEEESFHTAKIYLFDY